MNAIFLNSGFYIFTFTLLFGALFSLFKKIGNQKMSLALHIPAMVGSAVGVLYAILIVFTRTPSSFQINFFLPISFSFNFRYDMLSSFFLLVVSLVSFCASLYGASYMRHTEKKYALRGYGFSYHIFLLSMFFVPGASDMLTFMFFWEAMTITSYFLVIFERDNALNLRSGFLYFVMSHAGTALLFIGLFILQKYSGSFSFEAMRDASAKIPMFAKHAAFIFLFFGLGTKAGIIPLHIWLPRAHPSAPSHVSALMSGVMIKLGIYMMFRMFLDIIGVEAIWWGIAVLAFGGISSLLGVLYALTEHDLKRLLAYHSVENIGIILLGLGSAMIFQSLHRPELAAIGIIAALFHTFNHAIFKALLFLGAGGVALSTHTRNIEEYGGLIKYMPYTAIFFLIGSASISGLPPFNGFASEYLVFQSLFIGILAQGSVVKIASIVSVIFLAFTSGLAAACFVKAFGVSFLAKPRSRQAESAKEVELPMLVSMGILSTLCIVAGIFSPWMVLLISRSLAVLGADGSALDVSPIAIHFSKISASLSLPVVFIFGAIIFIAVFAIMKFITRKQKEAVRIPWDCGNALTPRMEITGQGFAHSLVVIFKGILRPTRQTEVEYHDAQMRYFVKSSAVHIHVIDYYQKILYQPLHNFVLWLSHKFKIIQSGYTQLYILYIFITLIFLLSFTYWTRL